LVEIPAGSSEKAEVDKKTGQLSVELIDGQPRRINYLAYPFNYGLVPRTLSPLEAGGDGDPLDVILLGEALEKGEFYACRLIGVLQLLDRGEQDDKLVAVLTEGPFAEIYSIAELDTTFIGISSIIEIWFNNYKGVGKMKSAGFAEKNEADRILQIAIGAYQDQME
jgi:inorganic pyrophosphatase